MKKVLALGGLILLMSMSMFACGNNNNSSSPVDPGQQQGGDDPQGGGDPTPVEPGGEDVDYGRVYFKTIYIYADMNGNSFDEVTIYKLASFIEKKVGDINA